MTSAVTALTNVGFTATTAEMLASTTYRDIRIALRAGSIVRLRPGLFGRPGEDPARSAASRLDGVVSHASAAEHWDLPVLNRPDVPHVTVPRKRKRRPGPPVEMHWADLSVAEREAGVTEPLRTVLDCARTIPFGEALAVADKAVQDGWFGQAALRRAAERLRGPGCGNARRVAESVDPRVGSGLESALRAILIDGGVTGFEPQVLITGGDFRAQVDLAHRTAGIALEADAFEFHGTREGLVADCWRYDELVALGWRVLRFSFEQILGRPTWVLDVVRRTVDRADELVELLCVR